MEDQWTPPEAHTPSKEAPSRRRGRDTRLVLTGVVLALLVWFAIANFQDVTIRFWLTTTSAPLIVVIAISGVLGAAVSALWARRRRRRTSGADGS
ncbi:MAG: LapA family protein [Actinomycetota bacterium]|nr:LapA family protein [Actinomycetota bacterium]